ncbi:MAG: VIT domain-containing protein [Verrucomicrobiales bacterium]|nr:VIT domain-containing protein [Verrucomicrobiales bacterium]
MRESSRCALAIALLGSLPVITQGLDSTLPTLSIKEGNARQHLAIQKLVVAVECVGLLAEISYDITYANGSRRNQEGEFQLELPPGARVSSYSLEVEGRMRPAVSVEKEKALHAYESIKRRGVDPGIVEKVGDTSYRTRIFPILPNSTKRVRISYLQKLPRSGELTLPISHDSEIDEYKVIVRGAREIERGAPSRIAETETLPGFVSTARQSKPDDTFHLRAELSGREKPLLQSYEDPKGNVSFLLQGNVPEAVPPTPVDWPELHLIWDASRSRDPDRKEAELIALRSLWKELGTARVLFHELRNTMSNVREFQVVEGRAAALEKAIQAMPYDGVADFSQVPPSSIPTLLVSDGRIASPLHRPAEGEATNCFLLHLAENPVSSGFPPSGFQPVSLSAANWTQKLSARNSPYAVDGIEKTSWTLSEHDGRYFLSGTFPADSSEKVIARIGRSSKIPISTHSEGEEWNLLRRFHALQRLDVLEQEGQTEDIIRHAKKERLATDYTSLIVLEEFRDHLLFKIPPPEPELLEKYERELKERNERSLQSRHSRWDRKREQHAADSPWIDAELKLELQTVSVWVSSANKVFPPEQRNQEELRPYEEWTEAAEALLKKKDRLESSQEVAGWMTDVHRHVESLQEIRKLPPTVHEKEEIHVSVRGFVNTRGLVSDEGHLSLRKAIRAAGDPNHYGSREMVYLYRNASRTGYNLKSPRYVPIPLEWGDMVVVETLPQPSFLSQDGFAADPFMDPGFSGRASGGSRPAVFEEGQIMPLSQFRTETPSASDPFGSQTNEEGRPSVPAPDMQTSIFDLPPLTLDEDLLAKFQSSETPGQTYRSWLKDSEQKTSLPTLVEIARILFDHEEVAEGMQCLSNLLELQSDPIEASRSMALWLADFGKTDLATAHLERLLSLDLDPSARELIQHDLGRISSRIEGYHASFEIGNASPTSRSLFLISLVDLSHLGGIDPFGLLVSDPLPSDLRIVITTAGADIHPTTTPPARATEWGDAGILRTATPRVSEFLIRQAWPGRYQIEGMSWESEAHPTTVCVEIYSNWGRESQTLSRNTFWMTGRKLELGTAEFSWK